MKIEGVCHCVNYECSFNDFLFSTSNCLYLNNRQETAFHRTRQIQISLILMVLYTESGVVTHPRRSRRYPAISLNDLDFADDIALLESSISSAQDQLTRTAAAAECLGLIISIPKTEYMTINCNPQP